MVFFGVIYLIMLVVLSTLFFATSTKKTWKERIKEYFSKQGCKVRDIFAIMAFLWPIYLIGTIVAIVKDTILSKYRDKFRKR